MNTETDTTPKTTTGGGRRRGATTTTSKPTPGPEPQRPQTTETPTPGGGKPPPPALSVEGGAEVPSGTPTEAPSAPQAGPEEGKVSEPGPSPQEAPQAPTEGSTVAPVLGAVGVHALLSSLGGAFTTAGEVDLSEMKLIILIYGDSGAGKTHLASCAEDVVVALLDTQGFATIRSANPKAIVAGKSESGQPRLKDMEEVRGFFKMVTAGILAKAGVKTIVLDHIGELQKMMMDEIVASKRVPPPQPPASGKAPKVEAPKVSAQAKGPPPEMQKGDWGTLATKMRNFLRMLRSLPHNIVILSLDDKIIDEETGRRMHWPKLQGSMQEDLPSFVNIIGYLYKFTSSDGKIRRAVLVDGDDRYCTKPYGPIQGIVAADIRLWFRLLAGGEGSAAAEGATMPGGSSGRKRGVMAPQAEDGEEGGDF